MALAAHHNDAQADGSVLWLGPSALPQAIAGALLARGVGISAGEPHDRPHGRLAALTRTDAPSQVPATAHLSNRRILLLHSDPERANLLSWALSARGALARTFDRTSLDATAAFDADVVLVDQGELLHACWDDVRAIWRHGRLRWTPCLLVAWSELESDNDAALDILCHSINQLSAEFDAHAALARKEQPFQASFRALGPARSLRAVLAQRGARELRFAAPRVTIDVHVANGLILGARGRFTDGSSVELQGARALACLVAQESGTLQVSSQPYTALSNIMMTLDEALVRGPDGALLSESVIALLPTIDDTSDECGLDDETLFMKRTPSTSGIRERIAQETAALPSTHPELEQHVENVADDDDDNDDGECRIPTRKHRAAPPPEAVEQAEPRLISPPALITERPASEPPEASRARIQLRCDELADARPAQAPLKPRAHSRFASILAVGITLCGVLCVESDKTALEQLVTQGLALIHALIESAS